MARLFLSYATPDHELAASVFTWLTEDGHDVFFDRDIRNGIPAGEDWKRRLYHELNRVDAVVCVLSDSYISSTWCTAEVAIADARGCLLIPLLVEEGVTHPLIERQQRTSSDPAMARKQVLTRVRRLDSRGLTEWRDGDNPYPGLAAFTAERSRLFFGRSREVRKLATRLRADTDRGVLAITGASGCGKSSLLRAGLLPAMEADPGWLVVDPWTPEGDSRWALATALTASGLRLGLPWSLGDVRARLNETRGLRELADEVLIGRGGQGGRVLIAIDQAEELFSGDPDDLVALAELIASAITGPVRVVVTVRLEYLDDLAALPGLSADMIENEQLGSLARDMLKVAIEEPARIAGFRLEPELSARLIADTETSEALPLLAFALHQLAEGNARGDTLSVAAYDELGARNGYRELSGLHGVLAAHADSALQKARRLSGLTEDQVLTGLVRLVSMDDSGRLVRRSVSLPGLELRMNRAIGVFVDYRLLTGDDVLVRFAHEALLTAWRPLADAIAKHSKALRTAQSVDQAAREWITADHADSYLWDEERYTAATVDLASEDGLLDADGREFLEATREKWARRRRRERSRRRRIFSVLAVFSVVALVAAIIAAVQATTAQNERDTATVRELIARADSVRAADPQLALRLSLAAHSISPSRETEADMLNTLTMNTYAATITGHTSSVFTVAFSPDRRTLVSGDGDDHTVRLWDVSDVFNPKSIGQPITDHTTWVQAAEFSRDGHLVATASHRELILWKVDDPAHPQKLSTIPAPQPNQTVTDSMGIAFSPDGNRVASSHGNAITLWDVTDPARPAQIGDTLMEHDGRYSDVAFSSDGRTLAGAGNRGSDLRLWDVSATPPVMTYESLKGPTTSALAFMPDRPILALAFGEAGDRIGGVELYNVTDPGRPTRSSVVTGEHTSGVRDVAFTADGTTMATASFDQTVSVMDVSNPAAPRSLGAPLTDHSNQVFATAFAGDGTLATASADNTIILWAARNPVEPRAWQLPQLDHDKPVTHLSFGPDGRTLVSTPKSGPGRVWDISAPERPRGPGQLTDPRGAIASVALRPDGFVLATGSGGTTPANQNNDDNEVTLWDVSDPVTPKRLGGPLLGHRDQVVGLSFSADGKTLWSANKNVSLIRWDVSDPAKPRQTAKALTDRIDFRSTVVFRPDHRAIASRGNGGVVIRDISSPDDIRLLDQPMSDHAVADMVFSPDGKTLITGGKEVLLWDVSTAWRPRRYGSALGAGLNIASIALSGDGKTLVVGDFLTGVTLWNVEDPRHPYELSPALGMSEPAVSAVATSHDGRLIATGSSIGEVVLWDASRLRYLRDNLVDEACARARRGLSEDEWTRHVGTAFAHRRTCG